MSPRFWLTLLAPAVLVALGRQLVEPVVAQGAHKLIGGVGALARIFLQALHGQLRQHIRHGLLGHGAGVCRYIVANLVQQFVYDVALERRGTCQYFVQQGIPSTATKSQEISTRRWQLAHE